MKDLEPSEVWGFFEEILAIPRISRDEEKIIDYITQFAGKNKLDFKKDKTGNCLVSKPASRGFENRKPVILQSHLDMVGEKLLDVEHDFTKDPIKAVKKEGWITAEGTTLGADDGIGVAASLAVLVSDSIQHGPLECLFTVDEETGMAGAFGLEENFMQGKILLNLDSEDEGEIFIGCAGGIETVGHFKKRTRPVQPGSRAMKLTLEGLQGGHSGDEIHKGYINAIKLMNRLLWILDREMDFHIVSFEGGNLRNAIPREATAIIVIKENAYEQLTAGFERIVNLLGNEIKAIEPGCKMRMESGELPERCYKKKFQRKIMNMLFACPHGVIEWSRDIDGLVETSTNLAVLKENESGDIEVVTSQRSSRDSAKSDISDRIAALFQLAGGEVKHSGGYPGWVPNRSSEILRISERIYSDLFATKPKVKAIHAGLECGLFLHTYPELDMISFGPTIKGAHTPEEKIHIGSVDKFWKFLIALLENIPQH